MRQAPSTHIADSLKLEGADAYIDLFEIFLYGGGSLYLCGVNQVTWQGTTYNYWGLALTGEGSSSNEATVRPQLSLANFTYDAEQNPVTGVFSALKAQNKIEGATVLKKHVLKTNIEQNLAIYETKQWRVARIVSVTDTVCSLELRNALDVPRFQLPSREYIPPDFPQVSLI